MTFSAILFYILAAIVLYGALRTVTAKNPVHAALHLVLTFCVSAMIWMLMQAEFLGVTLVVVYVGAVMVLFLFVVMMLNIDIEEMRAGFWRHAPHQALRHRPDQVHLLRLLRRGVSDRCDCGNPHLRIPRREKRRFAHDQADPLGDRRQIRTRNRQAQSR